jgi:hypothetical protein
MPTTRILAALLLCSACATAGPSTTRPADDAPAPTAPLAPTPPTIADASPPTAGSSPPATPAPAIDPTTLSGYVMSREASPGIPEHLVATVTAVASEPAYADEVIWRITLEDAAAKAHELKIHAPAALPAPLRPGDRVQASIRPTGGGPNQRYALVFTDETNNLLLAVNTAPPAWKITRGPRGAIDRGSDYNERSYGVTFEHAGVRASVAAGAWSRMTLGADTYYIWGSGAQRRLRPGKRPMPDYVGSWLDYAIVRAR